MLDAPTSIALPALVDRAAKALAGARTAAEVLEAREMAAMAVDAAKRAKRLAKAKRAHDDVLAHMDRARADALQIETQAKARLADEYDAAQERGEVAVQGQHGAHVPDGNMTATAADVGLSRKDIHEARLIRDAEAADPGVVRRVLDEQLAAGEEPDRAAIREAVIAAAQRGFRGGGRTKSRPKSKQEPDPEWDAMLAVSAGCREIMGTITELGALDDPGIVLRGFLDVGQRERNLADIRQCRDYLSRILEVADAG